MVDKLFDKPSPTLLERSGSQIKTMIIYAMIFIVLSLTAVDDFLRKMVPVTATSQAMLLLVKGGIFAILVFMVQNLHLVSK